MPRADYVVREAAVRETLDLLGIEHRIPRYYGDKIDFGDIDVLVQDRGDWDVQRAAVVEALGITDTKTVGRVFSTAFRGLQTDFFPVAPQYLGSTYDFMSFNDLGNLLGRICRRFELKWGELGLAYVFRRTSVNNHVVDLPITQDFGRVCEFLGLEHAAWVRGFATLVELYEWVVRSPYFSVAPYLDDPAGAMAKRGRDRPTIARFVEFLRERDIAARPVFGERSAYLDLVVAAFPEARLAEQLAAEHAAEARAVAIAARWSGKLVMRLRPERGQALGELIMAFKRSIIAPSSPPLVPPSSPPLIPPSSRPDGAGEAAFEAWVLATPEAEIERRIIEFRFEPRRNTY